MAKTCTRPGCTRGTYKDFCLAHAPRKPIPVRTPLARSSKPIPKRRIRQQSDKEKAYQLYKEEVLRPALIARDGNRCSCCLVIYPLTHTLDIEHTLTKGSRPDLKRDLGNLTLMDRICHTRKTNGLPCEHEAFSTI